MTNAHQALRDVPPPRRLLLATSWDPAKACLRFEVADTGPGIPLALQPRIFEPFFTTKAPGLGTGLGLSLCRGIIEGHGGTLSVQSQPGQGTLFSVEFPLGSGNSAAPDAPSDEALSSSPARIVTILVIDDEPGIASALVHINPLPTGGLSYPTFGRTSVAKRSIACSKPSIEALGKSQRKFWMPNSW